MNGQLILTNFFVGIRRHAWGGGEWRREVIDESWTRATIEMLFDVAIAAPKTP